MQPASSAFWYLAEEAVNPTGDMQNKELYIYNECMYISIFYIVYIYSLHKKDIIKHINVYIMYDIMILFV